MSENDLEVWDFEAEDMPPEDVPLPKRLHKGLVESKQKLQHPRDTIWKVADKLIIRIREEADVSRVIIGGSYRRGNPTCGDVDLLVQPNGSGVKVLDVVEKFVDEKIVRGDTVFHGVVNHEPYPIPIDVVLTKHESWGSALQHITGDFLHNRLLRTDAKILGLKMNEYGVWNSAGIRIAGNDEHEVYAAIGKRWIHPKFRQDRRYWKKAL